MVKKISYTIVTVLLICTAVGYFRYYPTVDVSGQIPKGATEVVKVNLRQLEWAFVKEALQHPSQFMKSGEQAEKGDPKTPSSFELLRKAIDIPANLMFYRGANDSFWLSTAIAIKDADRFEEFTAQLPKYEGVSGYQCFKFNALFVIRAKATCHVVYTSRKSGWQTEVARFLTAKEYEHDEHSAWLTPILEKSSILSFTSTDGGHGKLQIQGNSLVVEGNLGRYGALFLQGNNALSTEAIASISGKIDTGVLSSMLDNNSKQRLKKVTGLDADSLMFHWTGALSGKLAKLEKKRDTIVSYEYDDDFNKVAVKKVVERWLPSGALQLQGTGLSGYLERQGAIKTVDGETRFVWSPLFKTTAVTTAAGLRFQVGEVMAPQEGTEVDRKDWVFNFTYKADPQGVMQGLIAKPWWQHLDSFECRITTTNTIRCELQFDTQSQGIIGLLRTSF